MLQSSILPSYQPLVDFIFIKTSKFGIGETTYCLLFHVDRTYLSLPFILFYSRQQIFFSILTIITNCMLLVFYLYFIIREWFLKGLYINETESKSDEHFQKFQGP